VNEAGRLAMLARVLSGSSAGAAVGSPGGIEVGIGDDAAVLALGDRRLVWTVDEQVEGTHFRRDLASWHDIGWRSFMAAASDVAAMGAEPWCALSALVLPDDVDDAALEELARGQRAAAVEAGAPVVGGNLARGPALSIATTLLGTCERAILRRGALAGDGLWMAGRVGLAAAGLRALGAGANGGKGAAALEAGKGGGAALEAAVEAWRRPRALVAEGRAMGRVAHAAVDVSDGLACDVGHMADASAVGAVLDEDALLADDGLAGAASALGVEAIDLVLYGGEDYALVVASPVPIDGFRRIGEVTAGRGVALRSSNGERPIEPRGFDHFTSGKR
jgi:thiamine-monophosphate kinase